MNCDRKINVKLVVRKLRFNIMEIEGLVKVVLNSFSILIKELVLLER